MFDDFTVFKEELKNRIDIIDVIGEFVELKKHGSNYSGLCPFHTEKAPSFSVNRSGQFYYCFGCGKGGDVIGFMMDITGMSFMEAVGQLAERVGLEVPKTRTADSEVREEKELLVTANLAAAEYFFKTLTGDAGKAAMEYLTGRGLTPETIKAFRLGYGPEDPSGLIDFAKKKGIGISALESVGILLPSKYGGPPYNRFEGRVLFPIIDQTKRVIGFGARLLEGEGAKYINSPESAVYHKSHVLFGIHQAKDSIKRSRKAVVVEGYMDVISLHQAGIKNVIASSGTAFTVEQGRIISRMVRDVTLLFDGDSAGLTAAARGADNLLVTDLAVNVAVLPEGHDPDSYVSEYGSENLIDLLDNPDDLWEFKLRVLGKESQTVQEKIKLAGEIADSISLIPSDIKRDLYIYDMSVRIGVDRNSMHKAVYGRIRKRAYRRDSQTPGKTETGTQKERDLLAYIISYPELARHFMEEAGSKPFSDPVFKNVADVLFHRIVEGLDIKPSALMSALTDKQAQEVVAAAAVTVRDEETAAKFIEDNISEYKKNELGNEIAELNRLKESEKDVEKKKKYEQQLIELNARLKEVKKK